ncbi:hypothetical protein [Sinomicrobium weinanense]|uniref:Uncharacterized protein n=1 Tax=Sinomicrobium weinanense TaxID=2842200 RepID=A0A926JPV6_9FLAO|nr:hypothetical protein [Sinomicrobium weinanense]MBC9795270.1 hypothetical protein [Sinomicrobium weinanense]MBU3125742.1 hypothetical protein [Sinomicrobium weinanense]
MMSTTADKDITYVLHLNKEQSIYHYKAEVYTRIKKGETAFFSKIKMPFSLRCEGAVSTKAIQFRLTHLQRVMVDEKGFPLKKLSKARQIALKVATINDELVFEVSSSFEILRVVNTSQVREKWEEMKPRLVGTYPDIKKEWLPDFEWQLREENIQDLYKKDTFYAFLFAGIFNTGLSPYKAVKEPGWLNNAVGSVSLPLTVHKKLKDFYRILDTGRLEFSGKPDSEHPKFPLQKLNVFTGNLTPETGSEHKLSFKYNGYYNLKPKSGRIDGGALKIDIAIGDLYRKETDIHLKMLHHE